MDSFIANVTTFQNLLIDNMNFFWTIRYFVLLKFQDFDEATDMAGKPIPGFLCRVLTPENVLLALHDRASQVSQRWVNSELFVVELFTQT